MGPVRAAGPAEPAPGRTLYRPHCPVSAALWPDDWFLRTTLDDVCVCVDTSTFIAYLGTVIANGCVLKARHNTRLFSLTDYNMSVRTKGKSDSLDYRSDK